MTTETTKPQDPQSVMIGSAENPVRFSYLRAHKPKQSTDKAGKPRGEPKYSAMIIVPKDGPWEPAIKAAMQAATTDFFGANKKLAAVDTVFRDGDDPKEEEKGDAVKGCWFFNATSVKKPDVAGIERDEDGKLVRLSENEIKSGDWGRVRVRFYGYDQDGGKGIAASLGNIQKLEDGEPLGNQRSADDDFDDTPL